MTTELTSAGVIDALPSPPPPARRPTSVFTVSVLTLRWVFLAVVTLVAFHRTVLILVDSTRPETFRETNRIIDFFVSYRDTPYVVAANKQDKPNAWSPDELRLALRLPPHIKVLPCVAAERESVKNVLLELLYVIMQQSED